MTFIFDAETTGYFLLDRKSLSFLEDDEFMMRDYLPLMLNRLLPPVFIYTRPSETVFAIDSEGRSLRQDHDNRSYCHKQIWNATYAHNAVFDYQSVKKLTRTLLQEGKWKTYKPESLDSDVKEMCEDLDKITDDDDWFRVSELVS